jgi:hypothetical protein
LRSLNAHWFAGEGARAAWGHVMVLQHSLEDVEAAFAAGDYGTCVDCCFDTVLGACFVLAVLDGYAGSPGEPDMLARAIAHDGPATELLDRVPVAHGAGRETAESALELVRQARELVDAAVPIRIEGFRTPEGFYPGVRVAAGIEKLRQRLGLPPYAWQHFTT